MRSLSIITSVLALLLLLNQTFADPQQTATSDSIASESNTNEQRINTLVNTCFSRWEQMDWRIGQADILAKNNPAFSAGIKRICQAKAELFFEGYEISPFIEANSQEEVFLIVFQPSVESIKEQLRVHLPKLRLI